MGKKQTENRKQARKRKRVEKRIKERRMKGENWEEKIKSDCEDLQLNIYIC